MTLGIVNNNKKINNGAKGAVKGEPWVLDSAPNTRKNKQTNKNMTFSRVYCQNCKWKKAESRVYLEGDPA